MTTAAITFDVPNLDCELDPDDMRELADTLHALAAYARIKADAMSYRQSGRIADAMVLERHCERIYANLPDWARW